MRTLRWMLLVAVGLVLADTEKDMSPVEWSGGEMVLDSGEKVFNGLATRAQIHDNFCFVTIPKLKPTVRATCCKLDITNRPGQVTKHVLTPFPPGKLPHPESCESLQSAVDLCLDHFDTLWILDVGAVYPPKHPSEGRGPPQPIICPPKVVAYDANTGKELHRINLINFVGPPSRLQFIICDYSSSGKPFIYVSDAGTKAIIVWDVDGNKGHRVQLPEGILNDYAPRDVLYMVLVRKASGHNKLYFTYRSGEHIYCIDTHHLQSDKKMDKAVDIGKKPSKLIFLGTDEWESIYFRKENNGDVYKWKDDLPFEEKNFQIVHKSDNDLTPTHAIADYKNGVMRLVESNLLEYLKPDCSPEKALNSLTVMSVSGDQHQSVHESSP